MQDDDLHLLGIPRSRSIIAKIYPHHDALSKSESYKSKKIELIDNSFIIEDHEGNVLQEHLNNIKIEHAYYINNDIKKDFNIKIATFANI